ncbi:MAG: hypothetical protein IKX63_01410 [Muribaculaceae bacterium]|nr:hypothetical protein [Muribaculaceae bacterium]
MKKTFLFALVAVFAASTVMAQDFEQRGERRGPDPEKRIEHQVKRLDKKLNLTEEQQTLLMEYYTEFDKAQLARMEQVRQMEKKDREALDGKIKAILTDEQKAKYDEMKDKEKEMWKAGRGDFPKGEFGPGRGPGRGNGPGHRMGPGGPGGRGASGGFEGDMRD